MIPWISASERLPEPGERVLVATNTDDPDWAYMAFLHEVKRKGLRSTSFWCVSSDDVRSFLKESQDRETILVWIRQGQMLAPVELAVITYWAPINKPPCA